MFKNNSYQRYDDHRYDQPQISNLDRPRNEVEFDRQLKSPKINVSQLKVFGESLHSNSVKSSSLHCAMTNPKNPLHLDFQGVHHQERVRVREQYKQNAKEYNRAKSIVTHLK
jgi:hypothetical protein